MPTVYADETAPDGHHSDDVMAGSHHGNAMPDDHHGNLDPHSEEDIEAVLRSKQAEVTDLIAKCGEMLRSVYTTPLTLSPFMCERAGMHDTNNNHHVVPKSMQLQTVLFRPS